MNIVNLSKIMTKLGVDITNKDEIELNLIMLGIIPSKSAILAPKITKTKKEPTN